MSDINSKQIVEALQWRYATKRFDPTKKISDQDWQVLAESLRLSPSSYGLQPFRFLVIQTPELRQQLRTAAWNQSQVTDASHFVVFASKAKIETADVDNFIQRTATARNIDPQSMSAYRQMMEGDLVNGPRSKYIDYWAQRQAYIALGVLLETAALLKIDACPLEGLEPARFDQMLGLEGSGYLTVCSAALGYRHPEDKYQFLSKVRFDAKDLISYR